MFTGIVEELGRLRSRDGARFVFEARRVLEDAEIGDSISHNGCCLTVVEVTVLEPEGPDEDTNIRLTLGGTS